LGLVCTIPISIVTLTEAAKFKRMYFENVWHLITPL
jgi:hypothetical protein